ncbi:MAG: hypothetical protein ACOYKN_12175 [Pirellula sp.]
MRIPVINRRPVSLGLLGLAMLVTSFAGCQTWWNRSNSKSLLGFANEGQGSDDWEHPSIPNERDTKIGPAGQSPKYNSPRTDASQKPSRVTLPRNRQKEPATTVAQNPDLAKIPAPRTAASAPKEIESKSQNNLAATLATLPAIVSSAPADETPAQTSTAQASVVQASATGPATTEPATTQPATTQPATKPESSKEVRDSGLSDVDVQGALSLLPGEYQSALRKKISGEIPYNKPVGLDPKDPNRWTHELNQSVVALEKFLEASSEMEPAMRLHHEMTLRLLYLAQRKLELAQRPISGASPREQQYLDHQLSALFQATSPDSNPSRPRHWAQVAAEQKLADRQLAALSNLQVSSPVFCTQVDGYGVTHKFEKNCFAPDQQLLLYCELENVTSQKVREGYETKVRGTYEIRDSQGKRVVEQALPMEPDLCSNQRRDFFLVYMIFMPPSIDAGKYELILTMEDLHGNKFGTSKSEFEIKK